MPADTRWTRTVAAYAGIGVVIALFSSVIDTDSAMSAVWYGPYLSSAENVSWGGDFRINLHEVKAFREMTVEDQQEYRFTAHHDLQEYIANPVAFSYVIAVAKQLFPWLSDVRALVAFQILLHVLLCLLILALLTGPLRKLLFFMLYAINPLVIYFVTFPFYYFYQAVPSFALIFLLLARGHWKGPMKAGLHAAYLALCISLSVVLLIRSTTVAAIAAFFVLAFLWLPARRIYFVGLAAFVLIAVTGYSPSQKNFWHTAYIGIGAYPNEHMQGLSDNNGYALFERQTGVPLDASLGGNYYDGTVMSRYREISRVEFLAILRSDWPALMRNAVMNTLQGFTVGYLVGRPFVMHLAMTAAGLMVLVLLALSRQYVLAALIIVSNATFTLYYPPIPAYMYGAYALLAMGVLGVVDYFRQRFSIGRHERLECAGRS